MTQLRIGILGCGRIALSTHVPILSTMPEVKVVALAEPDGGARTRALAMVAGASGTADWREVIAREDIDAVIVCLPSAMHAEVGIAALNACKHLYLEKPIACGLPEADHLLNAHRGSGRVAMTGFNYRFHPLAIDLKKQVQSGRIGNVLGVQTVFSTNAHELPPWKAQRVSGGGVLLDLASHHVDLIRFLLQTDIQSAFAQITSIKSEGDTATLTLRTVTGESSQSFFSLRGSEDNRVEILGTKGKLFLDLYRSTAVEYAAASGGPSPVTQIAGLAADVWRRGKKLVRSKLDKTANQASWRAALAEFVAAATQQREPSCNLNDGYASLAIIDAAERSHASKASVELRLDTAPSFCNETRATNISKRSSQAPHAPYGSSV